MKMNTTAFGGIALAIAIIWFGVIHSAKNPAMFLDQHAILLVLGGTLAAALIAFPGKKLYALFDFLFLGMLFPARKEVIKVAEEMLQVNYLLKNNARQLEDTKFSHGFVREIVGLLMDQKMTADELHNVLKLRSKTVLKSYQADAKILNALAKFPPAFGLLGATTGMIEMMSNLGKGGASSIGSAMAIALVATFWGIAIANFVLLPLADRAGKMATDDAHLREMIIEGTMVIKNNGSESLLLNSLRGFLPLMNRNTVRGYSLEAASQQLERGLRLIKNQSTPPAVPTQNPHSGVVVPEGATHTSAHAKSGPIPAVKQGTEFHEKFRKAK